jgi:3-oxoacyl-[acyl-carrier-protein] synthase II
MNSFLAAATAEAIQHSSLDFDSIDLERVGLAVGILSSNITKTYEFSMESLKNNYQNINRLSMLHILASIPTGMLNVKYKTRGPSITVSSACASGLSSVVEGYKWIKYGEADVVIAAATEDTYNPLTLNSSLRLQAMNSKVYEDPALASCPFDQARAGFVLGEGSGALILESEEHAKKRGACILAEVLGYGTTSDGYHLVKPE